LLISIENVFYTETIARTM